MRTALFSAAALLSASTAIAGTSPPEPRNGTVLLPPVGERLHAAAGDALAESKPVIFSTGAALVEPVTAPAKVEAGLVLPVGAPMYEIGTSKAFKACAIGVQVRGWEPCLIDDDGDGTFDRMARNDIAKAYPLPARAAYKRLSMVDRPTTAGLRRVIVYQGAASDSLRLSYREFVDNLARDAFTEELTIPLAAGFPQQFAAKGITFTLYGLSPLGIDYQIDSVRQDGSWGGVR